MANGTVSLHSWADGAEEDDGGEPGMGSNYNARLERKREFDVEAQRGSGLAGGGNGVGRRAGLRSRPVRGSGGGRGAGEEGW
jgi:hypothetical protein